MWDAGWTLAAVIAFASSAGLVTAIGVAVLIKRLQG
jgi:hypothetical protein